MQFILLGLLMAQANPVVQTQSSYDDYMTPAVNSWCEDNKVVQTSPETGKAEVADDCSAEGEKCRLESLFDKYVNKYTIYAYCSEK